MHDKKKRKTIKLTGQALELGKVFVKMQNDYMAALDKLKVQHRSEYEALCDEHERKLKTQFSQLAELVGIKPEDEHWHMDCEYLEEHGELYLGQCNHDEEHGGSLKAMLEKMITRPREH